MVKNFKYCLKKGAQRQNIVPYKNTLLINLLFRQEVLHYPQLFPCPIINAERKVAVVRVKFEGYQYFAGRISQKTTLNGRIFRNAGKNYVAFNQEYLFEFFDDIYEWD